MLCIEIAKAEMTPKEVARAYNEMEFEDGHWSEVFVQIQKNYDLDEVGKFLNMELGNE